MKLVLEHAEVLEAIKKYVEGKHGVIAEKIKIRAYLANSREVVRCTIDL